jgi:carboxyl-terminal processing protease
MPKRNLAWILVITMITVIMWQMPQIIAGRDAVYRAFGPLVDARSQIRKRYVDDINDNQLTGAAVDAGIKAMVEQLDDVHAVYMNETDYARFKNRTDGVFGGIGVDVWPAESGLEVLSRAPNSPASAAGILPGDIITHIDGRPTNKVPLVDAVNNLLNGPPETRVTLTLTRPSDGPQSPPRQVIVERAVIHVDPIRGWSRGPTGGWRFMLDPERGIGYIRLTKFTPDADGRLDAEVERLLRSNLRGLILDLRDNTGGLLDSAREVADRFLDNGLIVRTAGRRTDEKAWYAMRDGTYPDIPLVVLVNGFTASAAEIVAGALRDHHRAMIIGERTYGKGSVQEVVELDRHSGAIKLTTAYYYLPSGQCIHRTPRAVEEGQWGVVPNIPVNLSEKQRAKWQTAWREVGREPVNPPETSQPTTTTTRPEPVDSEGAETLAAANALLGADLQLAKAVEFLRSRLPAPTTQPVKPGSGD